MGYAIPGATRRHPRFLRVSLSAAALSAGLAAAGPAVADSGTAEVVWLGNPPITVAGNGNSYVSVDPSSGNIGGQIKVRLDAGVSGRVKSFEAWPSLKYPDGESTAFKGTGISLSKTYSFPRPKQVVESFFFSIPRAHYQQYVVDACNAQADLLRAQGLSDNAIFSQDRSIDIEVSAGVEYDMSGLDKVNPPPAQISYSMHFTMTCKRLPPRVPNPIAGSSLLIRTEKASNHACELRLHGVISTYTPNVQAKFRYIHADGQQSDQKTVTTDAQGFVNFTHVYPLPDGIKNGKIRMVGEGPTFQSDWADYEADCDLPPQDLITVLPPKVTALEAHAAPHEIVHQGFACPSTVRIFGIMNGRGTASGAASLFAADKLKKLQQYNIEDGQTVVVEGEHELDWSAVYAHGGAVPQQSVKLTMNVTNALADLVDHMEVTQNFACRETSGVAEGAVGGVSTGNPAPTHSQPAAAGQVAAAPALAVMAPKGLTHSGEIRLSGGAANAKYKLTFLRKQGGGYVAVNAAQLPKQMTGLAASFPLKALSGGRDWRLEVCPLGGAPTACKASDFRLPRLGAGAGTGAQAPAPAAGSTVYIVPGALN